MRPQQNRRMRGRGSNNNNNNNRKGPNPLTRSYESNGPDVKIRGTAQQIAEKYTTLARDAQSSGDRVIGENYLQHAEHYNRIIMTAQAQQQAQQPRDSRDDDDDDRDDSDGDNSRRDDRQQVHSGSGPQPVIGEHGQQAASGHDEGDGQPQGRRRSRGGGQGHADTGAGDQPGGDGGAHQQAADPNMAGDGGGDAARKPRRARKPRKDTLGDGTPDGEQPSQGSTESVPEAAQ